jgi:hypothetical protein
MLVNAGDPRQWTYLKNLKKKHSLVSTPEAGINTGINIGMKHQTSLVPA